MMKSSLLFRAALRRTALPQPPRALLTSLAPLASRRPRATASVSVTAVSSVAAASLHTVVTVVPLPVRARTSAVPALATALASLASPLTTATPSTTAANVRAVNARFASTSARAGASPASAAATATSLSSPLLRSPVSLLPAEASMSVASVRASVGSNAVSAPAVAWAFSRPFSLSAVAKLGRTPPRRFLFRSRADIDREHSAEVKPHPSAMSRVVESDNPVYANRAPFNWFYLHNSTWVIPIDPAHPGKSPLLMYLSLFAICLGVFWAWKMAMMTAIERAPLTEEEYAKLTDPQEKAGRNLLRLAQGMSQAEINHVAKKMDWMGDNFTVNVDSFVHRPWTIFTSAISHQSFDHLFGNFTSLFLFAPKVYNFLGPRYFTGLYLTGALGCSAMHCLLNVINGRTEKGFGFAETLALGNDSDITEEEATKIMSKVDMPLLGASGSCMAISAAAAVLFPRDHIFMRLTYVPIPFAVAMYAVIDLSSMFLDPNSEVGHAGHVGGFLMGAAYVAALWRFKRINGVTAAQRFGKELPIQAWFKNRPNPIGFIRSAAPAGPPPMH